MKEENIELYDLSKDPKEETNVAAENLETLRSMREAVEGFNERVVPVPYPYFRS